MSLAGEITRHRDDCLDALDAAHDYFARSIHLWNLARASIDQGESIAFINPATGNEVDGPELSRLADEYANGYLASATFQEFVGILERFLFGLIRTWLIAFPENLAAKQLQFRTVLDAADRDEIIAAVAEKEVLGLAYQRIADWFAYLNKLVSLECPNRDQIERLAEIKASRDVLVHNRGIANAIYVAKSLGRARFADGEFLELPADYHRESWALIKEVVAEAGDEAVAKAR